MSMIKDIENIFYIPVDVINIILDYADIYCEDCFRNNMVVFNINRNI